MTISSPAIRRERIHVKFMYILQFSRRNHIYDIGILDDKYNYYEEHIGIISDAITPYCFKMLNRLFGKYLFTKESEIDMLEEGIKQTDVIYMYLMIRNQSVFANIRFLKLDMIPRRIATYHVTYLGKPKKPNEISRYHIERIWKKLVELEKCPWINKTIDTLLNNMSLAMRKRMLIVRMALYYMIVKRFLLMKSRGCAIKANTQSLKSTLSEKE